ncbi:MAG: CRR6 family NdhI maturation factor, partial [Cyanobacteriota bacterium]
MASPSPAPRATALEVGALEIGALDLNCLAPLAQRPAQELLALSGQVQLSLEWPRPPEDPRELSEIPEVRLWCLRADALYPWLPLVLERSQGTLTRHVAMLLPHSFSRTEGIRFAPDSLELWISHRLFLLDHWARGEGLD